MGLWEVGDVSNTAGHSVTRSRRRRWRRRWRSTRPKGREDESGDQMEQELRGKYAISMETVALIADIKVIFFLFFF